MGNPWKNLGGIIATQSYWAHVKTPPFMKIAKPIAGWL
jgi:hypothetical protein